MICLPLSNFSRGKAMMTVISSLTDASSVQFSRSVVSDSAIHGLQMQTHPQTDIWNTELIHCINDFIDSYSEIRR